jgi:hypothetical protein
MDGSGHRGVFCEIPNRVPTFYNLSDRDGKHSFDFARQYIYVLRDVTLLSTSILTTSRGQGGVHLFRFGGDYQKVFADTTKRCGD